jgi:vesicle-fusing ATPase
LLRPGRLEVQIEVPLPDRKGRREILKIHFGALRANGRLSQPLCRAIDGPGADEDVYERRSAAGRLASWVSRRFSSLLGRTKRIRDLAADRWTGGFSGADIEGLVRNAGSIALARSRCQGDSGVANLLITLEDTVDALQEIKRV